jgi:hypothetical protein
MSARPIRNHSKQEPHPFRFPRSQRRPPGARACLCALFSAPTTTVLHLVLICVLISSHNNQVEDASDEV